MRRYLRLAELKILRKYLECISCCVVSFATSLSESVDGAVWKYLKEELQAGRDDAGKLNALNLRQHSGRTFIQTPTFQK